MNFKVQYGKKIHKLPSGLSNFDELLYSVRSIFTGKLPDMYTFTYEDEKGKQIHLESQKDFKNGVINLQTNGQTSMKLKLVRALKPTLDLYVLEQVPLSMTESRIGALEFADVNASVLIPQQEQEIQVVASEVKQEERVEKKNEVDSIAEPESVVESISIQLPVVQAENIVPSLAVEDESALQPVEKPNQLNFDANNLETLRGFIEEVVEEKLRLILQNYDLVPKQPAQIIQQQVNNSIIQNQSQLILPQQQQQQQQQQEQQQQIIIDQQLLNKPLVEQLEQSNIKDDVSVQEEFDRKKLRAMMVTDPPSELSVVACNPYAWTVEVQNTGSVSWPLNTQFKCLAGPHLNKTHFIGILQPNQTVKIVLPLEAPEKQDKYPEVWSLVHEVQGSEKPQQTFGPKVRYTLIVKPVLQIEPNPFMSMNGNLKPNLRHQPENEQKIGNFIFNRNNQINSNKPSISVNDSKESQVNDKYLRVATEMKDILGGDIKKYIQFLQKFKSNKVPNIQEAINSYLESQKF